MTDVAPPYCEMHHGIMARQSQLVMATVTRWEFWHVATVRLLRVSPVNSHWAALVSLRCLFGNCLCYSWKRQSKWNTPCVLVMLKWMVECKMIYWINALVNFILINFTSVLTYKNEFEWDVHISKHHLISHREIIN